MANSPEQDWFRVYVGDEAEVIVHGETEQAAIDEVVKYCNENPVLKLDPEMMLPHGVWGKPLESTEADLYVMLNQTTATDRPRLIADHRRPGKERPSKPEEASCSVYVGQLALFRVTTVLGRGAKVSYSYFNE